jgi:hypothetical protein
LAGRAEPGQCSFGPVASPLFAGGQLLELGEAQVYEVRIVAPWHHRERGSAAAGTGYGVGSVDAHVSAKTWVLGCCRIGWAWRQPLGGTAGWGRSRTSWSW